MIIISLIVALLGAYFIYFGADTVLCMSTNIWYVFWGVGYVIGGILLIGYISVETCDHYGWLK